MKLVVFGLTVDEAALRRIGSAGRAEHTSEHRARPLVAAMERARMPLDGMGEA